MKNKEAGAFTHPEKIIYPEGGITKADLRDYYLISKDWVLPHVVNKPLTLVRCPNGYNQQCFYQKHVETNNNAIYNIDVLEKKVNQSYAYIKNLDGLIQLVQLSVLEIHVWGCHIDKIEKPDVIIFDLDQAPNVVWSRMVKAAFYLKEQLEKLNLQSFVKTTGGKGLHVVVPIKRNYSWEQIKFFSHEFVKAIVQLQPTEFVESMSKEKRQGKIFIDYLRNYRGATAVAPYSTRARRNAPIATPISWKELTTKLAPDSFNIRNIGKRLAKLQVDPWENIGSLKQTLPKMMKE